MKSLILFSSIVLSIISSIKHASAMEGTIELSMDDVVIKNHMDDDIIFAHDYIMMKMVEVPGYEDWKIGYARVDPEMVFEDVGFIFCEFFVRCRFVKSALNPLELSEPGARGPRIDFHDDVLWPGADLAGPFSGIRYVVCTQYGTVDGQR